MAGYLTTHVLDTALGRPAAGLEITLYRVAGGRVGDGRVGGGAREEIARAVTNADGRTDAPILDTARFATGEYELVFAAGDYLVATGRDDAFLGEVPVRFRMAEDSHYHVPLLLSPFGYSTYRGS
jgi:5-hydroxyisourate hydrolase